MKLTEAENYIQQKIQDGILVKDILEGLSKSEIIMVALLAKAEEVKRPNVWRN